MDLFDSEETYNDPAADFLAREQEELGDLGQELGLSDGSELHPAAPEVKVDSDPQEEPLGDVAWGVKPDLKREMATPSPKFFSNYSKPKVEPETIKKWREKHERTLKEKDQNEAEQKSLLKEQAKKELSDWYKQYNEQLDKTKASNRENEKEFVAEVNDIMPGTEWDRVAKLCDFSAKNAKSKKDTSRMKQIMLHLKQEAKSKA